MKIRIQTQRSTSPLATTMRVALVIGAAWSPALCFGGDLPSSAEIVAKMIEGEGGAAAKRKIRNREVKLKMDMGMGGMVGNGVSYTARPGNARMKMEISGMGTIEEGVTDGVAWSFAMMMGPQIKEGSEKSMALWESHFDGLLDWKGHFKSIECVSKETLDGKEYFKVEFTRDGGNVTTSYVDMQTYRPYRTDMKRATPMGEIDLTAYSEDYREIDGLQFSHTTRMEVMGQKRVITIESIKHNVDLPKDCFKLPEDVQDILTVDTEAKGAGDKAAAEADKAEPKKP